MIDFACKSIEVEDLIRCSFQLSKTEYMVLETLLGTDGKDAKELAKKLELDRSTVHKSLKTLQERELVKRRQYNVPSGGYKYVYRTKEKGEIKKRVRELIETWSSSADQAIRDW